MFAQRITNAVKLERASGLRHNIVNTEESQCDKGFLLYSPDHANTIQFAEIQA